MQPTTACPRRPRPADAHGDSCSALRHAPIAVAWRSSYFTGVAESINEVLQETGFLTLIDISRRFALPLDTIMSTVTAHLTSTIHGRLEHNELFTDAFVARERARIRGVFSAITRPTSVATLIQAYGLHSRLFDTILSELMASWQLDGSRHGSGGAGVGGLYVPSAYTRMQQHSVSTFYQQNSFVEYDALRRLGITDPPHYMTARWPDGVAGHSCYCSRLLVQHIDASAEEALSDATYVDVAVRARWSAAPCAIG